MTRTGSDTTSNSAPCTGSPGGRTDTISTQDRETALRLSVWSLRFNGTFPKTGWSPSAVCLPLQARMPPILPIQICPSFGCGTRAGRLPCDSPSRENEQDRIMGNTERSDRQDPQTIEQAIRLALRGIRFGSIEIIVHDSKVVQIERKEKIRFNGEGSTPTR